MAGLGICIASCWPSAISFAQDSLKTTKPDSAKFQIVNPYLPNFSVRDRHGDPFSNYTTSSPFILKDPKNLSAYISQDTGIRYNISEKRGKLNFRHNSSRSFRDCSRQQEKLFQKDYYQNKSVALN